MMEATCQVRRQIRASGQVQKRSGWGCGWFNLESSKMALEEDFLWTCFGSVTFGSFPQLGDDLQREDVRESMAIHKSLETKQELITQRLKCLLYPEKQ